MAKKQEIVKPDWETSNIGLMLFTSLMIILLAFFILLSTMAVIDEKRKIEALGSLVGAFGILPGGLSATDTGDSGLVPPASPMDLIKNDMEQIRQILSKRLIQDKVRILEGKTRRIISLETDLLFAPDSVELLPSMEKELLKISEIMKGSTYPIIVQGHTDDQPPQTEAFRDNWQISALRAVAVLKFLMEKGGIDPNRLSGYGYAGNRPVVPNKSPKNRARNNRIDLILDYSLEMQARKHERNLKKKRFFDFHGFSFSISGEK